MRGDLAVGVEKSAREEIRKNKKEVDEGEPKGRVRRCRLRWQC